MKIIGIRDWTIPAYGNKRLFPYGHIKIECKDKTGKTIRKVVFTKEEGPKTFFTANRKRYYFRNIGQLHEPNLEIIE